MNEIVCPYCEHPNEDEDYTNDRDTGVTHIYESCGGCGKNFGYSIEYTINYYTKELPCLNGESHSWREILNKTHYPFVLFDCKYCGTQKNVPREQKQVSN